ncbi:hypothetical protein AAES_141095 [Amazona aestiva]|uniref:Uncharacterized protein n=1 Tax=Amazona aestiva TaxID=12930 RepID=A0A0Q3PHX3_AMAAE|nr:hypothetical protein AAES_141095 [Amazona aestiva]
MLPPLLPPRTGLWKLQSNASGRWEIQAMVSSSTSSEQKRRPPVVFGQILEGIEHCSWNIPFKTRPILLKEVESGYKELFDKCNEASTATKRERVTTDGSNESEDEGTDFAGLETEKKMKKQADMPRQPKSVLAESSEEDDDPCNVLAILESSGNARTILYDNSSHFGKLLNVHLRQKNPMNMQPLPVTEIRIAANLLRVTADFKSLQIAVTHRITATSYDWIFTTLSVEGATDAR